MPEHVSYEDADLLLNIARGDSRSFRLLYERYWNQVFSLAVTYLKHPLWAEDVLQEIFIKIWAKREKLPEVQSLADYIFIITRNELISALRRQATKDDVYRKYAEQLPGAATFPDKDSMTGELEQLIHHALNTLTPQQRLIYRLSRDEGLTLDEIASQLGLSKKTVSNTLSIILSEIRAFLRTRGIIAGNFILFLRLLEK